MFKKVEIGAPKRLAFDWLQLLNLALDPIYFCGVDSRASNIRESVSPEISRNLAGISEVG